MINNTLSFLPSKKVFINIPDTNSYSYRFQQRSDMQTRIYAQMLFRKAQGYKFYFGTLTYAPKFRPYFHIKRDVDNLHYRISDKVRYIFLNEKVDFNCPCFSRKHINKFIRGIQMDLLKKYHVTDIDYVIACEYGSKSEFCPHYHFILMIPSKYYIDEDNCGNVNAYKIHSLVKKHWSVIVKGQYNRDGSPVRESLGFLFPRTVLGGFDRKGHFHKPFEVDSSNPASLVRTAIYTSKYCCKQIGFWFNPSVKLISKEIKNGHDVNEVKRFNICKPFVKTSLHFGECLKDVLFGCDDWSDGLFSAPDDPLVAMYEGFHCPLKESGKNCSFPQYIKRKVLYDYYLDFIRYDETYPDLGIHKGLHIHMNNDEVIPTIKKVYQYGYELSVFGKEYKKYEFQRSIDDYITKINDFRITDLHQDSFKEFLDLAGYEFMLDQIVDFLNLGKNIQMLSVYRKVYKDRINPIFYLHYIHCPDDFVDVEKVEYHDREITIVYKGGYEFTRKDKSEYYVKYRAKDMLSSIVFQQYVDFVDKYNFGERFPYPYFDYQSDANYMLSNAYQFYISDIDLYNSPTNSDICKNFPSSMFFNSFPCFANFDIILLLIESYFQMKIERKLKTVENKEKQKSNFKNQIYAV